MNSIIREEQQVTQNLRRVLRETGFGIVGRCRNVANQRGTGLRAVGFIEFPTVGAVVAVKVVYIPNGSPPISGRGAGNWGYLSTDSFLQRYHPISIEETRAQVPR